MKSFAAQSRCWRKINPQSANHNKSCLLFSSAEMFKKPLCPDQTAPIGAVCSVSTQFTSILISSVMLDKYLLQTNLADDMFRYIFFSWRFKG